MANLLAADVALNYKGILNLDTTTINTPLDVTLRSVTDGMGNASPLLLSTTLVRVNSNLIIGTSLPAVTARVAARGDGTNPILYLESSSGAQRFRVNDNGDVEIGRDVFILNNRFVVYGSNTSGTLGVLLNALSQGVLSLKDAGAIDGATAIRFGNSTALGIINGTGTPESVITAPIGSIYQRKDGGGVLNTLYLKTSGTGSTGWVGIG